MSIVGGLDIHRKQLTFDYVDLDTGEVRRGRIAPADREHLAVWLARFVTAGARCIWRSRGVPGGGTWLRSWLGPG